MSPQGPPALRLFIAVGLALSVGWGIRGNFGHEFGALLPGALASLAAVLAAGRSDWHPRVVWAGLLGAVGWSFGGSISYMQVIAYTCSGHSPTIAYGFASLFLVGFLWAAPGAAGLGLALELPGRRLRELPPMLACLGAVWSLQSVVEAVLAHDAAHRHEDLLYWYDTDWLAALTALLAAWGRRLWARRWDTGTSLVAWAATGWWAGFLCLVVALHLRMTPPRGDNWAGMLGMVVGLALWLWRRGWGGTLATLLRAGAVGGAGFAGAALLQVFEADTGLKANWHSVLEQTYGLVNGLGIAWAVHRLRTRLPAPEETEGAAPCWHRAAAAFVLVGIPWLNLQRCVETWVGAGMPASMAGIRTILWFHGAMLLLLVLVLWAAWRHGRAGAGLALLPAGWEGRGQLLLLGLLASMVAGNLARALPGFAEGRLVTEGVVQFNAMLLAAVLLAGPTGRVSPGGTTAWGGEWRRAGALLAGIAVLSTALPWGTVRAVLGDRRPPMHSLHVRFGPGRTAVDARPKAGEAHP